MPSDAYRGRMFSPEEVRRILRRAADLQDAEGAAAGRSLTLEEVERVAADAGIGEEALRRALSAPQGGAPAPRKLPLSFAGAPSRISVERTVAGRVSAVSHGKLARAMRAAVGEIGNAQIVGDSLAWSATQEGGRNVYAVVEPEGDARVVVRVDENLRKLRGGLFGGILGGMGGGGLGVLAPFLAAVSPALVPVVMVAWLLASYALARTLYVRRFRAREAELRAVVDEVAALVEAPAPPTRIADEGGTRQQTRVDDAAEEDATEDARDERLRRSAN